MNEESYRYARIYYKLAEALSYKEEGLVHADSGIGEPQLILAYKALQDEDVTGKDEMLKLIMTASKGWANPLVVKAFLENVPGGND